MKLSVFKFIAVFLIFATFPLNQDYVSAQTNQPLVQFSDLEYLGAFRLPRGGLGTPDGFSYAGGALAYDSSDNSLYVSGRDNYVGKVSITTPIKSSDAESLPFSTISQSLYDPTGGARNILADGSIRGLLLAEGTLYGTVNSYYDAGNKARVSHFSHSKELSSAEGTPLKALWKAEKSGYVSGWLASVPVEWQSALGGSVISGNCCVPIVSRTSYGPSAFSWTPSEFNKDIVPANPLLYYPSDHPTLGDWGDSNPVYGATTQMGGMAIPNGTRSILYFGLNGTGEYCYGIGGATGGECVDPLSNDKGQHAYPYNYQIWAYDLNDLVQVKDGSKNPWDVKPYGVWTIKDFEGVFVSGVGGVAYDSQNQIIYVSQARADKDGYSARPLIHAYKVKVDSAGDSSAPASSLGSSKTTTSKTSSSGSKYKSSTPKSTTKLQAETRPAAVIIPEINMNLGIGNRNEIVKLLQSYLISLGYLSAGNNTGYYGELTRAAVKKFQLANKLPATGFFGPMSRGALNMKRTS